MIAWSKRLPLSTRNPASGSRASPKVRMTSRSVASRLFSPSVRPLTVGTSARRSPCRASSCTTAGTPPARWNSSPRYFPAGWRPTSSGTCRPSRSQAASGTSIPVWRAIAGRALRAGPPVQRRAAGQRGRRDVHRRRGHQAGRRGRVGAGGQHDAVDGVAVERLDQAEVGEVAIQRGGRPLAGLLDRVHRELDRDPAGLPDAFANPLGQLQVMAVARGEIRAGLRDADDRLAGLQLVAGEAPVQVPLGVEGGHPGVGGVVEPGLAAQGHRITVPLRRPGRKTNSAGDHAWEATKILSEKWSSPIWFRPLTGVGEPAFNVENPCDTPRGPR